MTGTNAPTPTHVEVLLADSDGVMVLWRRAVLVQVRKGSLTGEVLVRAGAALRPLVKAGRPVGALFILESTAKVAPDSVRAQQAALLDELARHPTLRMAPVVLGDSVGPSLNRSAGRLVALGNKSLQRFTELPPAVEWLAAQMTLLGVAVRTDELAAIVAYTRNHG